MACAYGYKLALNRKLCVEGCVLESMPNAFCQKNIFLPHSYNNFLLLWRLFKLHRLILRRKIDYNLSSVFSKFYAWLVKRALHKRMQRWEFWLFETGFVINIIYLKTKTRDACLVTVIMIPVIYLQCGRTSSVQSVRKLGIFRALKAAFDVHKIVLVALKEIQCKRKLNQRDGFF